MQKGKPFARTRSEIHNSNSMETTHAETSKSSLAYSYLFSREYSKTLFYLLVSNQRSTQHQNLSE